MERNILVFDPDTLCHDAIALALQEVYRYAPLCITFATTDSDYRKELLIARDAIFVNFQTLDFWNLDAVQLKLFITVLKSKQPNRSFGVTGNEYQKKVLESYGLKVITKCYLQNEIARVLGISLTKCRAIENIHQSVCDMMHISSTVPLIDSQEPAIVGPRQIIMYFARKMTNYSLKEIGQYYGRDYTTVIHSVKTVTSEMDEDPTYRSAILEMHHALISA